MSDFDPSSVPLGVDEEVGGTPASTIRAARKIERRGRPLPQPEQGVGDAWILIAFIVALGLIFVVAAWVLAGSDVPAERESNGQGIIASSTPTRVRPCPGQCPRREGRSYTCLSNGKLERNIGECAGSGGYPIPLPKDPASLSSTAKPSHRTAPHRRADQLHERDLWSVCTGVCNSAIYNDKDEAANRGGVPTLRVLFFFEA